MNDFNYDGLVNNEKRLLCIIGNMDAGGAETFLMKVFRAINKDVYVMDFCVSKTTKGFYDEEIIANGGKIHYSPPKTRNFIVSFFSIAKIVKVHGYSHVLRISPHSLGVIDLIAAKFGGAEKVILRSANTKVSGGFFGRLTHGLFKSLSKTLPDLMIAPSTEAALHMFGKTNTNKGKVLILKNGLPIEKFIFDDLSRKEKRNQMNLDSKIVIGHIGRFHYQKNHSFLIDVFLKILLIEPKSVLLLVGDGHLRSEIEARVERLGIKESVCFTGIRSDVRDLLMAMDVFLFPSHYEGMPNTVIEAQATGLPCVVSDSITKEVGLSDLVFFESLESDAEIWAKKVIMTSKINRSKEVISILKEKGYDIEDVVNIFLKNVFC